MARKSREGELMSNFINDKVLPKIMAFVNTKAIQALKDGLLYSMPLMIVGSVFLILAFFPYQPIADAFAASGLTDIFNQAYGATFNIMSMVAVVGISYTYVKNEGYEGLSPAVISLACFILLQPAFVNTDTGTVSNVIIKDWTSGKGMICAILVGLCFSYIYCWFMKKDITIKMPEGVPAGVANSFIALIPAAVLITLATLIHAIFTMGFHTTFVEWIYVVLQTPLQGITDSLGGVIVMAFMIPFLWFFGIHGATIIGGIMSPILQANSLANQAIIDAGLELTLENGGRIVTAQFLDQFITVTGSGITIGIVMYLVFFAKSQQFKSIGKLSVGPAFFNINEPILFGIPIVLNPIMAVPFILMPVLAGVIEYFALATGLCPLYGGVMVPWTTPVVISGFLIGGWRTALLQVVVLVASFFVYLPFIRKVDAMAVKSESEPVKD